MVAEHSSFGERAADATMHAREAAIARTSNSVRVEGPSHPDKATFPLIDLCGRIDWLVGAYGFESSLNNPQAQVMGSDLGAFLGGVLNRPAVIPLYREGDGDLLRRFYQDGDGWSVFTHNTVSLTDALKLTLGVRYLEENKTGGGQFVTQLAPSCASPLVPAAARVSCVTRDYEAELSDTALTYTAAVSYQLTSNLMEYGSISKGYKARGISLDRDAGNPSSQTFLPEESENYELGLCTEWFEKRVRANLIAFLIGCTDFQRNVFTGTETLLSNQGEVISQGAASMPRRCGPGSSEAAISAPP